MTIESVNFIRSIITPLNKSNVDTDQIIPKQFLKLISKTGFGKYLFYNWRFDSNGKKITKFVLNDQIYKNSKILVTRDNFGCGSSREHAVWALIDYGFKVIIAPSFADIFYENCFKNRLLPIITTDKVINKLITFKSKMEINLSSQTIKINSDLINFEIDAIKKQNILDGLDYIGLTFKYKSKIEDYEKNSNVPSIL